MTSLDKKQIFTVGRKFQAIMQEINAEAVAGAEETAKKILKRAQELAPSETGALRASGKITTDATQVSARAVMTGGKGRKPSFTVEFGGKLVDMDWWNGDPKNLVGGQVTYAAAVHELHPTHAHFLLRAEQELADDFKETLRKRTTNVIRRGGRAARRGGQAVRSGGE